MSVANVKHIQVKENKPSARCSWGTNGLHYLIKVKARVWRSSWQQKVGQSRDSGQTGYRTGDTLPKKGPEKLTSGSGIHRPLYFLFYSQSKFNITLNISKEEK